MTPIQAPKNWSAKGLVAGGLLTLAVLIGGIGTWSVMARIAGAIVASGLMEVDSNRQVVQHPEGGVVEIHLSKLSLFSDSG